MHELSALKALIMRVEEAARSHGGSRISAIRLRVSTMSGMDAEHLKETWAVASPGTMCEKARLEIEEIAPRLRCGRCEREFSFSEVTAACPHCGADEVNILPQAPLCVESFDIEKHAWRTAGQGPLRCRISQKPRRRP